MAPRTRDSRRRVLWVAILLLAGLLGAGGSGTGLAASVTASARAGTGIDLQARAADAAGAARPATEPDLVLPRSGGRAQADGVQHRWELAPRLIGAHPRSWDPPLGLAAAALLGVGVTVVVLARDGAGRSWRRVAPGRGPGQRGPPSAPAADRLQPDQRSVSPRVGSRGRAWLDSFEGHSVCLGAVRPLE